jgi:polyhydroxyalkanoate synthase subunit PhaC
MSDTKVEKLIFNFANIISKYFTVYHKLLSKQTTNYHLMKDPLQLNKLLLKIMHRFCSDPDLLIKYQMIFFSDQLKTIENIFHQHYQNTNFFFTETKDKRFIDNLWQENITFSWIKNAYFTYTKWVELIVQELPQEEFSLVELRRINFIVKQFLDAVAPTNFPSTNPQVLKAFFDSAGENFIHGLDNLLKDIENSKQFLSIKNNDDSNFKIGENIAATKGKVVYQNQVMQLLHYNPASSKQYSIPLLIVSPFINKYYVMDLHPEYSMVNWLLEQGYNVFLISWVNPDESLSDKNFVDYMLEGPIAAINYISSLGFNKVNTVGYCIGGTLLSCAISYMKGKNDQRVNSSSFFTTLIDFADAGDLSIFVDDHFINEVTKYMKSLGGYMDGNDMSTTFSLLKANDSIWPFYINNYLLGKESFPFDLLYWNSDSIRMPMALHVFYLTNMYKNDLLKIPNALELNGQSIDIGKIDIPCFFVASEGDHIVPWNNAFRSAKLFSGPVTFVLASSGHVAGIINHPKKNKYGYWSNEFSEHNNPQDWFSKSSSSDGSWWPYWSDWLKQHSGELVKAKEPSLVNYHIIEDAPGSYVKIKC